MQRALEAAMKDMGESTTSEDVAAFLRTELPELAQRRKEILNKAVEEARERVASGGETTTTSLPEPDVAFAPTVMSERQPKPQSVALPTPAPTTLREGPRMDRPSDAGTVALVRKKEASYRKEPPPATDVVSALDQEPIQIPKTSKAWLWASLLLIVGVGGAWYRWPTEIRQWLNRMGIGGGTDTAVQVVPVPEPSTATAAPSVASAPTESAKPATPPPATAAPPQPSAHPSASATAIRPEASATHHTWPAGHEPPAASTQPAPSSAPTATWSPWKTPPPAPTASDNPYQGAPPP
jgi:hypothetical protein